MILNPLLFKCLRPRSRFLVGLCRLPQRFHALEPENLELPALASRQCFHGAESPFELGVAVPENRFRIQSKLTGQVRASEQYIAEFVGEAHSLLRAAR